MDTKEYRRARLMCCPACRKSKCVRTDDDCDLRMLLRNKEIANKIFIRGSNYGTR